MTKRAGSDPRLSPELRSTGQVLLCIGIAVLFGALAALAAFVVGFLFMAAQGQNRTGPLLMLLGTPAAFVAGAWRGWRWARRSVAESDGS